MADMAMKAAFEIIKDPEILTSREGQYLIIMDQALTYPRFDNLNWAICLAAERGWKAIDTCILSNPVGMKASMMYVLMEKRTISFTNDQPSNLEEQIKRLADILDKLEKHLSSSITQSAEQGSISSNPEVMLCPKCNIPMTIKTVTQGPKQGQRFYVCSNYKTCQQTIPVTGIV